MFLLVSYFICSTDNCFEETVEDCDFAGWVIDRFKSAEARCESFIITSVINVTERK